MTVLDSSRSNCGCTGSGGTPVPAGSEHWCGAGSDLPVTPFEALRVTYGMLLGEDDFRVMLGNPRGKLMLHTSWLHGSGVVWGMRVSPEGHLVKVRPGLGIDRLGREVRLEVDWCEDLETWVEAWLAEHPSIDSRAAARTKQQPAKGTKGTDPCDSYTIDGWLVADFSHCQDRPVPALADPCDVTRQHTECSRVVETAKVRLVQELPDLVVPYHRVRVLMGLDEVSPDPAQDPAGHQALDVLAEVETEPVAKRPAALLRAFRELAAYDEMDLGPRRVDGDPCPPLTPVNEEDASILLAKVTIPFSVDGGCVSLEDAIVDGTVRTALLPTQTIQELTCGRAPSIVDQAERGDAGGPRLIRDSVRWSQGNSRISFRVTERLAKGSAEDGIEVSSLSREGRGWATDQIQRIRIGGGGTKVHVDLDRPPTYDLVRLVIRGTGPRVLFGHEPRVPFAGVEGGPPGTTDDGHDAIVTLRTDRSDHRAHRAH